MNELMRTALELIETEVEGAINSKVDGRRNWVIRVETINGQRVITYCGGYGEALRYGRMSCLLRELGQYKIRWYKFTYKKDYKDALSKLMAAGAVNEWA